MPQRTRRDALAHLLMAGIVPLSPVEPSTKSAPLTIKEVQQAAGASSVKEFVRLSLNGNLLQAMLNDPAAGMEERARDWRRLDVLILHGPERPPTAAERDFLRTLTPLPQTQARTPLFDFQHVGFVLLGGETGLLAVTYDVFNRCLVERVTALSQGALLPQGGRFFAAAGSLVHLRKAVERIQPYRGMAFVEEVLASAKLALK